MDDKTKLYIFEIKEVALIFIFMILIAITSFILGVRVGKSYSYKMAGLGVMEREKVDLLSTQEEKVHSVVGHEKAKEKASDQTIIDGTYKKLKKEFNLLDQQKKVEKAPKREDIIEESSGMEKSGSDDIIQNKMKDESAANKLQAQADDKKGVDVFKGKFTIQLGSHRALEEAEKFADGFRVRGYNPIINEVEIPGRGIWYRVSLGIFDSVADARDYIIKEKSLLQGQDYVIGRFD